MLSRVGGWHAAVHGWECVRSLARLVNVPDDARPWAALSRLARALCEECGGRHPLMKAAASLARGALEGLGGLGTARGGENVAHELAFAEETFKMAAGPEAGVSDGGSPDGGDDVVSPLPEPARSCRTLDSALLPLCGSDPLRGRSREMPFLEQLATGPDDGQCLSPRVALELRSRLGAAIAYDMRASSLRGGGDGMDPDRRTIAEAMRRLGVAPAPGDACPDGAAGLETAGKLLRESSEALDRPSPSDPAALDAKARLARFLMGDSGPFRVLDPLREELPPDSDIRAALGLYEEILRLVPPEGRGDAPSAGPVPARRAEAALGAARCMIYLGDAGGARSLRRTAAREAGVRESACGAALEGLDAWGAAPQILLALAESAEEAGDFELASSLLTEVNGHLTRRLGAHDRRSIRSFVLLARAYAMQGENISAAASRARAAESLETCWPLDPAVPELRNMAGSEFVHLDEPVLAAELLRRGTDETERLLGASHPRVIRALMSLGQVHVFAEEFSGAADAFRRLVSFMDGLPPGFRPRKGAFVDAELHALALEGLAVSLAKCRDFSGAAALFRRAREIGSEIHGPDSPLALNSLFHEAEMAFAAGDLPKSLRLHKKALAARKLALGPDHPDTLISQKAVSTLAGRT